MLDPNKITLALKNQLRAETLLNDVEGYDKMKLDNLNSIAFLYISANSLELALKYLIKSEKFAEKLNNDKMKAQTYNVLGMFYSEVEEHDKAINYLSLSVNLNKKDQFLEREIISTLNLGIVNFNKGDYKTSRNIFTKLLENDALKPISIDPIFKDRIELSYYSYLAKISFKIESYNKANRLFNKVITNSSSLLFRGLNVEAKLGLAKSFYHDKKYLQAKHIIDALLKGLEDDFIEEKADAFFLKSKVEQSLGNVEDAFSGYKQGIGLREQIDKTINFSSKEALKLTFEQEIATNKISEQKKNYSNLKRER